MGDTSGCAGREKKARGEKNANPGGEGLAGSLPVTANLGARTNGVDSKPASFEKRGGALKRGDLSGLGGTKVIKLALVQSISQRNQDMDVLTIREQGLFKGFMGEKPRKTLRVNGFRNSPN